MLKKMLLIYSLLCFSLQVSAKEIKEVRDLVRNNLEAFYLSESVSTEEIESKETIDSWKLSQFYLRLKGKVSFEIPFFASISLIPHIEFIFKKS